MKWLSLRKDELKFKTAGKLQTILEESMEYISISEEKLKDHNM